MTRYTPLWLQQGSYAASVDRRLVGALWPAPASAGCAVTAASGMAVNVAAGQVAVPSQNSTGSTLCTSDAVEPVTITAAPGSGTNRIDVIICQPRGNDLDGGTNNDFLFTVVTGTPAASPTVPATPAGAVALAQILVPGGSANVIAGNITDVRPGNLLVPAAVPNSYPRGFINANTGPAGTTNFSGIASAVAINSAVVAGRRYVITAGINGQIVTAAAGVVIRIRDDVGVDTFLWNGTGVTMPVAAALIANGTALFTAGTTKLATFSLMVNVATGTGAYQVGANGGYIFVEDIGTG
jgi:hypothetical protein